MLQLHFFYVIQLQQERRDAELRAKREEEEQRKRREEKRRQQEEQKRREEEELFRRKQVGRSCLVFLNFYIQFKLESEHSNFSNDVIQCIVYCSFFLPYFPHYKLSFFHSLAGPATHTQV